MTPVASPRWAPRTPGVGVRHLLEHAFAGIYSLAAMPYVAGFFKSFAAIPQTDQRLLGWAPLQTVHEFAFPPLLVASELISFQLAKSFWLQRRRGGAAFVLLLFLFMQSFPAFSVYLAARGTDYAQSQAAARAQTQISPEATAEYERQLRVWNNTTATLQAQLVEIATQIENRSRDRAAALDATGRARTLAERTTGEAEVPRLAAVISGLQSEQTSLRQKLTEHLSAQPAVAQKTVAPSPVLREGQIDFIVRTVLTGNAALALFVASLFVVMVFSAGAVFAAAEGNAWAPPPVATDLAAQIRFCATLPPEQQPSFVRGLIATIEAEHAAQVQAGRTGVLNMALHLELEQGVSRLEFLSTVRRVVLESDLVEAVRADLLAEIDRLAVTWLRTRSAGQSNGENGAKEGADLEHDEVLFQREKVGGSERWHATSNGLQRQRA